MLPLSSPYQRTSSRPDNGINNISTVNSSVLWTLIWFALSIASVIIGFWHCRSNAFNYSLVCDTKSNNCILTYPYGRDLPDWGNQRVNIENNRIMIAKEDIEYSESVRIDENNKVIDTSPLSTKEISKLGMTNQIKYKHLDVGSNTKVTNTILFPPIDMTRRKAQGHQRKFKDYQDGKEDKRGNKIGVNLQYGKMVTAAGIIGIIFGVVSTILSLVLGTWKDDKARRPWARGRKRAD